MRHLIADDANGDLLIDPGIANSGANDKLIVEGNTDITAQLHLLGNGNVSEPLLIGDRWAFHNGGYKTINYNAKWNASTNHNERIVDGPYAGIVFTNNGDLELRTAANDIAGTDVGAAIHFVISNGGKTLISADNTNNVPAPGNFSLYVGGGIHTDNIQITDKLMVGNQTLQQASSHYGAAIFTVSGKMVAQSCIITMDHWADDVFKEGYRLPSLQDVKNYIAENNHLPGMPSEKEVLENGIALEEMNAKLLRKIEELTLYVLSLKEENEEIKLEITRNKK